MWSVVRSTSDDDDAAAMLLLAALTSTTCHSRSRTYVRHMTGAASACRSSATVRTDADAIGAAAIGIADTTGMATTAVCGTLHSEDGASPEAEPAAHSPPSYK